MANAPEKTFVVAFSSSALFSTKEGAAVYESAGEEAFIKYQIEHEDSIFPAGPAMPIAKALLGASAAIKGGTRIKLIILSHNNPAASMRIMRSATAHDLPITRASFVGGAPLDRYLNADNVSLLLSSNAADVRTAINHGIAAAKVTECSGPLQLEENQLRVAFDWDAVIASDESERIYRARGAAEYQANEQKLEKVPLQPGPFEPVLRWMAEIQRELVAAGSAFEVRTAIVTARNEAAMNRVILTMRKWDVRVDETHFLGASSKDSVLQAFRPHIFFDDQAKNLSGVVPGGHVLFGIANEASSAERSTAETAVPIERVLVPQSVLPSSDRFQAPTPATQKDFEAKCRALFRKYTPFSKHNRVLDERFRVFITENSKRSGVERARILNALERYDLSDVTGHDPALNRELGDILRDKLDRVVTEAVAPKQQTLELR